MYKLPTLFCVRRTCLSEMKAMGIQSLGRRGRKSGCTDRFPARVRVVWRRTSTQSAANELSWIVNDRRPRLRAGVTSGEPASTSELPACMTGRQQPLTLWYYIYEQKQTAGCFRLWLAGVSSRQKNRPFHARQDQRVSPTQRPTPPEMLDTIVSCHLLRTWEGNWSTVKHQHD